MVAGLGSELGEGEEHNMNAEGAVVPLLILNMYVVKFIYIFLIEKGIAHFF